MIIVNILKKLGKDSQADIEPLKQQMKNPDLDKTQRRSLAGKILGIHRRYKCQVIIQITRWAIYADNSQASKYRIEQWQKANFGRSVSNDLLAANWCKSNRGCGERVELGISDETTAMAQELYAIFEPALKNGVNMARLKVLGGSLLDDALGL